MADEKHIGPLEHLQREIERLKELFRFQVVAETERLQRDLAATQAEVLRLSQKIAAIESEPKEEKMFRDEAFEELVFGNLPQRPVADADAGSTNKSLETSPEENQQDYGWDDGLPTWTPEDDAKIMVRPATAPFEKKYTNLVKVRVYGTLASNEANINPVFAGDNLTTQWPTYYIWVPVEAAGTNAELNSGLCSDAS